MHDTHDTNENHFILCILVHCVFYLVCFYLCVIACEFYVCVMQPQWRNKR